MTNPWIALLRGVNVGGHNKLPMADFRQLLTDLGLESPATYIQSGNAVFCTDLSETELESMIAKGIEGRFGFKPDVFVLSPEKLRNALESSPFPAATDDPKSLHMFFLREAQSDLPEKDMQTFLKSGQAFHLDHDVFYLFSPGGISQCALAEKLPRFIKGSMTARNLRSVEKILELADGLP